MHLFCWIPGVKFVDPSEVAILGSRVPLLGIVTPNTSPGLDIMFTAGGFHTPTGPSRVFPREGLRLRYLVTFLEILSYQGHFPTGLFASLQVFQFYTVRRRQCSP